jgi:hypothetical protein
MVKNHFHLALDTQLPNATFHSPERNAIEGGGSGSRSGPNLHREVTFGVRRPILLIGVVVSMGEKNAAVLHGKPTTQEVEASRMRRRPSGCGAYESQRNRAD